MFLYYFLLFIGLFFCLIYEKKGKSLGIVFMLLLTFFSMFRGINVGLDTYHYYNNDFANTYEFDLSSEVSYDYEFLTLFVSSFISSTGLNPRAFLWFLSITTSLFLFLAAKRFRVNYLFTFFFFFLLNYYSISLNQSRQIASAAVLLFAFSFLEEKDKKRFLYFIFVLLAASIHVSSIIFLPFYFVRYLKIKINKKSVLLIICLIFGLFILVQLNKGTMLNSVLSQIDQMSVYGHLGEETENRTFSVMGIISALITLVLNVFICLNLLKEKGDRAFSVVLLVTIFLEVLLSAFSGNIGRLLYGFSFIKFIAFSAYFDQLRLGKLGKKEMVFLILVVFDSYLMFSSLSGGSYGIVPYYITL